MTRKHAKELLPIITAFANGEDVEFNDGGKWVQLNHPSFLDEPSGYRIAPKPRKVWVNEYAKNEFGKVHTSKKVADDFWDKRIACHEIELPPIP